MVDYKGLTAAGYSPQWKKRLTELQIIQFVIDLVSCCKFLHSRTKQFETNGNVLDSRHSWGNLPRLLHLELALWVLHALPLLW